MKLPSAQELALWRDMHPNWTTVGETAEASGFAQSTISERLMALHEAGFVERRQRGKFRYYRPKARVTLQRTKDDGGKA